MSKSINQALLVGNTGKDPDVKTFEGGLKVATFSIATSTGGYKKQDGTEVPEKTSWHNIVAWRSLAELAEKYIHKGDKVMIMGSINYRDYEKDGIKRYATDIVASDIILCGHNEGSKPPITAQDAPYSNETSGEVFPPHTDKDGNASTPDDMPF